MSNLLFEGVDAVRELLSLVAPRTYQHQAPPVMGFSEVRATSRAHSELSCSCRVASDFRNDITPCMVYCGWFSKNTRAGDGVSSILSLGCRRYAWLCHYVWLFPAPLPPSSLLSHLLQLFTHVAVFS